MANKLKLTCILAHPDDESLGMGGVLAKYASEGVETYLITATRGERGRVGDKRESLSLDVVAKIREAELLAAANVLGICEVNFLDYIDGDLDQADPNEAIAKIVAHLRRVKPHVVITFGPEGGYGHPDHIAISQLTTAAIVCAADASYASPQPLASHRVSKLYYMAWSHAKWTAFQAALREIKTNIDGVERRATPWPDWAITTFIDTTSHWSTVWRAVSCHQSQMSIYHQLAHLPEEQHKAIWGSQEFYRAFSLVNGGRQRERDLFEGLR
ncbi:PIG-L family deacetylase [candidate division KSB1 bacterium]|nr:PIG-L family deacetylase [candidate division KSB1 bacterium]